MKHCILFASLLLFQVFKADSQDLNWKIDPDHSKIQFIAQFMGISDVSGQFEDYSVKVDADKEDFTNAQIMVTIKANSLETGNDKRDGHLKSDDFLHVEKYPEIIFKSSSLKKIDDSNYRLTGNLTIKDVTKKKEFDVKYKGTIMVENKKRAAFTVTGVLDRFNFNVDWSKGFGNGLIASKEVEILCEVSLVTE